jgi:hypothetical protein
VKHISLKVKAQAPASPALERANGSRAFCNSNFKFKEMIDDDESCTKTIA